MKYLRLSEESAEPDPGIVLDYKTVQEKIWFTKKLSINRTKLQNRSVR